MILSILVALLTPARAEPPCEGVVPVLIAARDFKVSETIGQDYRVANLPCDAAPPDPISSPEHTLTVAHPLYRGDPITRRSLVVRVDDERLHPAAAIIARGMVAVEVPTTSTRLKMADYVDLFGTLSVDKGDLKCFAGYGMVHTAPTQGGALVILRADQQLSVAWALQHTTLSVILRSPTDINDIPETIPRCGPELIQGPAER